MAGVLHMGMTPETKTRAVAYIRVSTDKQADHGVSLAVQRNKVEAYASLYDLDIVALVIEDSGASAKTLERDGLRDALAMLTSRKADALLVMKLDRLTRSVRDLDTLITNYFSDDRFSLLSVSEQIDTRSAAGRLVLNILASVSQWEREAIGERTAAAMAHKKARGEYTGGRVAYGWRVGDDSVHLEPDDEEQRILRAAHRLRDSGLSLRKVGAALIAVGMRPRKGGSWHPNSIKHLLRSKVVDT